MSWFGDKVTWVKQLVVDEYHFSRQMISQVFGDNTYTPPIYKQPAARTQEERDKQSAEAKRYAESTKRIAQNFETGAATIIMAPEVIATTGTSLLAKGGLKVGAKTLLKKTAKLGVNSLTVSEDIANNILKERGEAPLLSPIARWLPWLGDAHYQSGGSEWDHPDRPTSGSGNRGIVNPMEMARGVKNTVVDYGAAIVSIPGTIRDIVQGESQAGSDDFIAEDGVSQGQQPNRVGSARHRGVAAGIGAAAGTFLSWIVGFVKVVLSAIVGIIKAPFSQSASTVAANKNVPPESTYASNATAITRPELPPLHPSPATQPHTNMGRG